MRPSNPLLARNCLAALFFAFAACNSSRAQTTITGDDLRPHISYLAAAEREGRRNDGKVEARDYIVGRFQAAGLSPLFDGSWRQVVPARTEGGGEEGQSGENMGAFVPGTDAVLKDEWIVINAHYDHLGVWRGQVYPGADDNASGVSMLLEVARQISAKPLKRSVAFVAFDFEESLLWGSRWFIGHTPMEVEQIKLSVTADMISRSLGGLGLPTVFLMGAEHSEVVRTTVQETPTPEGLEVAQLGVDMIGTRSDYGPFRDQRIPFLFFSTGEHPDYHTPRDTPERVDCDKAGRVCTLILQLVNTIGDGAESPEWEEPQYQKLEEARAVFRVTEQLMEADESGDITLSSMQRFFVSQVNSKTSYMLRRKRVSDDERKWVARTAQLLLLSVF
ncbi:M28 family peptidase [Planctomicrobium piriforme]|uniref:Peptidase family M28 n=1 Tax=Planctomicrobium piriforme TaxID=1576369 RepID=A0A1I3HXS6_9PLAN|nr:M28 family peptidase [Planctomicrobium piriforme]SFI40389.1 Peptidase family M28 [Planctomicrobium piriforme]